MLECYAIGDYSGLGHAVEELVRTLNSEKLLVDEFWKVTKKVTAYAKEKRPAESSGADEVAVRRKTESLGDSSHYIASRQSVSRGRRVGKYQFED